MMKMEVKKGLIAVYSPMYKYKGETKQMTKRELGRQKMSNKLKNVICIIVVVLAISIIPVLNSPSNNAKAAIKLNTTRVEIQIGKSKVIKINDSKKKVTWKSANKKIATVSKKGTVTGVSYGEVAIEAKVDGKSYYCKVVVRGPHLSYSDVSVYLGEDIRLALQDNNEVKGTWTSSNPSVAVIEYITDLDSGAQYADIKIKKVGTTTITVKVGKLNLKCKIKVIKKDNDLKNASKQIRKLAKKYDLIINTPHQIEFPGYDYSTWVALYDDSIGFVIPSYGTGDETFVPLMKEFIDIVMPESGDKIYNWLFDDMLSSRQLVLEDKTVYIFEYGAERFVEITNKVW